jgi:PPOX class probable F420-dependent enzyme
MLDLTQKQDAHIDQRLREDLIIWLNSVRPDGRPHSVAVWFFWTGKEIFIFSKPGQQKIRNLRHNPHVTLALDNTNLGADVITLDGTAELIDDPAISANLPQYVAKYRARMARIGLDGPSMAALYSQGIRITPTRFYR